MPKFITKNHNKIPLSKVKVSEINLKTLSDAKIEEGISDRKKLNHKLVQALISEKVRRSGKDTCGVCGTEFEDRGACKKCDADDDRKARNWSTMTEEQRVNFLRRNGLENDYSVGRISKMSYKELGNHWQQTLKEDGFGK